MIKQTGRFLVPVALIGLAMLLAFFDLFSSTVVTVIAVLITVATAFLWRRFVFNNLSPDYEMRLETATVVGQKGVRTLLRVLFLRNAKEMPRPPRADKALGIYHSINRGNLRATISKKDVPTNILKGSGMSINSDSKAFLFKGTNISSLFFVTTKERQCEPVWLRRRNNGVGVHCGVGYKDRSL